jgi:hypothetical protein
MSTVDSLSERIEFLQGTLEVLILGKPVTVPGYEAREGESTVAQVNGVTSEYFSTFGVQILTGRPLEANLTSPFQFREPTIRPCDLEQVRHRFQ